MKQPLLKYMATLVLFKIMSTVEQVSI